jgi:hypothetical protein
MKKPRWTSTYIPASILIWALFVALLGFGYFLHPDRSEFPLTAIVCLTAYVIGIPIGMAASPYREEGSHFKTIGGLVASFITGLAASKLAELNFKETFLNSALQSGRSMLFLAFLVLGLVHTFMFRRYYDATRPHDQYSEEERPEDDDGV